MFTYQSSSPHWNTNISNVIYVLNILLQTEKSEVLSLVQIETSYVTIKLFNIKHPRCEVVYKLINIKHPRCDNIENEVDQHCSLYKYM